MIPRKRQKFTHNHYKHFTVAIHRRTRNNTRFHILYKKAQLYTASHKKAHQELYLVKFFFWRTVVSESRPPPVGSGEKLRIPSSSSCPIGACLPVGGVGALAWSYCNTGPALEEGGGGGGWATEEKRRGWFGREEKRGSKSGRQNDFLAREEEKIMQKKSEVQL